MRVKRESKITYNGFEPTALLQTNTPHTGQGRAIGGGLLLLAAMFIVLALALTSMFAGAEAGTLEYKKEYPNGYAPHNEEDVITLEPYINGSMASIELRYNVLSHTLTIIAINAKNLSLYIDRAIEAEGLENIAYEAFFRGILTVEVQGGSKAHNATFRNLPNMPESIIKEGGEPINYSVSGNDLIFSNITTSTFLVSFEDEGGGVIEEAREGLDIHILGVPLWIWLLSALFVIVIFVYVIRN